MRWLSVCEWMDALEKRETLCSVADSETIQTQPATIARGWLLCSDLIFSQLSNDPRQTRSIKLNNPYRARVSRATECSLNNPPRRASPNPMENTKTCSLEEQNGWHCEVESEWTLTRRSSSTPTSCDSLATFHPFARSRVLGSGEPFSSANQLPSERDYLIKLFSLCKYQRALLNFADDGKLKGKLEL